MSSLDYDSRVEIRSMLRLLWGRVLTQVEAAMPPGKQCDQLKSLVKQHLRQFQDDLERELDKHNGQTQFNNTASSSSRSVEFSDREVREGFDRGAREIRESNASAGDDSFTR